ncbi:hypothetical protein FKM82_013592, partial [Ascaphus truei]
YVCKAAICPALFQLQGDFRIGGLFPIHTTTFGNVPSIITEIPTCERLNTLGYCEFQAMRLAIEEINNSTSLLPNITLGYDIFDTCHELLYMEAAFHLVSETQASTVIAVVGPAISEMTMLTSRVFSLYLLPQINYGANDLIFAQKELFPTLLHMVPTDEYQVQAIVSLMEEFHWEWIAIVGSNNKSAQGTIQRFISVAAEKNICVSVQGIIPSDPLLSKKIINEIVRSIQLSNANVTVVFSEENGVKEFFRVVTEMNVTDIVWIASDSWSVLNDVPTVSSIQTTGTVLGLTTKLIILSQLKELIQQAIACTAQNSSRNSPWKNGTGNWSLASSPCNISSDTLKLLVDACATRTPFYTYSAVYAVAHALHSLLQCNSVSCHNSKIIQSWQVLSKLKEVNFTLRDNKIYFDNNANPSTGYDIITWNWSGNKVIFKTIGQYHSGQLTLDKTLIQWKTPNNTIPVSYCLKQCGPGQFKSDKGTYLCFCLCDDCPEGTFQKQSGSSYCFPCPDDMWSPAKSKACYPRTIQYLTPDDPNITALLIASSFGMFSVVCCMLIFAIKLHTPIVKAAGGKLCFIMLGSLLISISSMNLFFGKPNKTICLIRQPLFAISFTTCVSCILVRSFQIVCIFKMATNLPKAYNYWVKYRGPYVCVCILTLVQCLFCSLWLFHSPPTFTARNDLSKNETYVQCSEGHFIGLGMVFSYITLLCIACFVFAFLGRQLPKHYNEAKLITFSMLVFILSW